jgi:hypothetical protein
VVNGYSKDLTGVGAAGDVGTTGVSSTLGITGNLAYGQVSQVIVPLNSNQALAFVGTVVQGVSVGLSGVGAAGNVGNFATPRTFGLTGNRATGSVGDVVAVYWKIIDDNQSTVWQNINTS